MLPLNHPSANSGNLRQRSTSGTSRKSSHSFPKPVKLSGFLAAPASSDHGDHHSQTSTRSITPSIIESHDDLGDSDGSLFRQVCDALADDEGDEGQSQYDSESKWTGDRSDASRGSHSDKHELAYLEQRDSSYRGNGPSREGSSQSSVDARAYPHPAPASFKLARQERVARSSHTSSRRTQTRPSRPVQGSRPSLALGPVPSYHTEEVSPVTTPLRVRQPPAIFPPYATRNFTHKFPVPSYAALDLQHRPRDPFPAKTDGGGLGPGIKFDLGMDGPRSWTSFKWVLLLSVSTVLLYGTASFVFVLSIWFQTFPQSLALSILNSDILILVTLASTLLTLTSLIGICGALLNSRPILAFYALLLWPCFISILTIGYVAYLRSSSVLDKKLNEQWSQRLSYDERGVIQQALRCCGYYNALHEVSLSERCYPRSPLPGCKAKLFSFEKETLTTTYRAVFSLVPLHLVNIFAAMLCSNHVNKLFGKGLTPEGYRLSHRDIRPFKQ